MRHPPRSARHQEQRSSRASRKTQGTASGYDGQFVPWMQRMAFAHMADQRKDILGRRGQGASPLDKLKQPHRSGIARGIKWVVEAWDGLAVARSQIIDMVNWWLRMTAPSNAQAQQIAWDPLHTDPANPLQVVPGFVAASSVAGSGALMDQSSIEGVNGHSLGGYLATAFSHRTSTVC